jgi:hypothetical protein
VESCICSWFVWVNVAGKQLSVVVQLQCSCWNCVIKVQGYGGKYGTKYFLCPPGWVPASCFSITQNRCGERYV